MIRFLYLALILSVFILNGCAQHPKKPSMPLISQDWPQHQARVQATTNWQAMGKLGVKTPNDGGSANLRWQQNNNEYQIDLNGPFGQGNMSIVGVPGKVTFSGGGNPPQSATSAEVLMLKNTGWNIPVTQLAFWVRGLPDPSTSITRFAPNAQGLIGELDQAGWKITYGDYLAVADADTANTVEAILMPGRITAEFKEIRLTLLIREWKLGNAP